MTHMRYWALTVAAAAAGGFIALDRFAFVPRHAIWIAFGVAIAAGVFSLAASAVALVRQNQRFSGLSVVSAIIAGFTIIATRTFTAPTALWLAFAGGVALLLVSLQALAAHDTTVERVVHSLTLDGRGQPVAVHRTRAVAGSPFERLRDGLEISRQMRHWMHWLTHTAIGVAGTFVVLTTFAWRTPVPSVQPRWVWFGVGVAAASIALIVLVEHLLASRRQGLAASTAAAIAMTVAAFGVAVALVVTMALHGLDYRWTAFGLGDGMVGVALLASLIHELSSERVRHELEVATVVTTSAELAEAR